MHAAVDDTEAELATLLGRGEGALAADMALDAYGDELYHFVRAAVGDDLAAAEVFSRTCTDLRRGVSSFRGDSSFRTWAYGVARKAQSRHERRAARKKGGTRARPKVPAHLSAQDEALVILRADRGLSWADIARVLGEGTARAAALRRRFERIRERAP